MTQLTLEAVQAQTAKVSDALKAVEAYYGNFGVRMKALHHSLGESVDMLASHFSVEAKVIHPDGGTDKP